MESGNNSSMKGDRGVSEVLGTILSLAITVLLFSVVAIGVLGVGDTDNVGMAYLQGEVYFDSNKIVLTHIGGDSILTVHLKVRLFINDSELFEPNFTLLTRGYTVDNDGAWEFSDRLMIAQNISQGQSLEVIIIDERFDNVIGDVDIVFRYGQVAPTTGSPTATTSTTTAVNTTTTSATTTATPVPVSIFPILDCVADNGDDTYTAYFGYDNSNPYTVYFPVGADNRFTPVPLDQGQPTVFECGRHYAVFNIVFDGSDLSWYLDGTTVTASSDPVLRCNELELTSECDGYWMVENTAPYDVTFDWEIVESTENGTRTIPAYYGTLVTDDCDWRNVPAMKMRFWTNNSSESGGSMTMRIYVNGILHDEEESNYLECFPHCYDFYTHSPIAYGINNSSVDFMIRTFQAANPQLTLITVSWTTSVGGHACTVEELILHRPGLDCSIDTTSPYCHFINNTTSCTIPAQSDITFSMLDFRDEDGNLMDMRGATIAVVLKVSCLGQGPFYETFLVDVPY